MSSDSGVVYAGAKVLIFQQITTTSDWHTYVDLLYMRVQRY